jgi:tetratricopeptide (TPR) repeat protein
MMRSKGWEMDDLDTTDWERYKTDPTYKAERDAKRRSQGKSVNQHIRNKTIENFKKSDEILKEAQQIQDEKEALEHDIETLRVRKRKLKDEVATTLTEANSDAQTIRDEAKRQAEAIMETARQNAQQALEDWKKDAEDFREKVNKAISKEYEGKYDKALKQYQEAAERKRFHDYYEVINEMAQSKITFKGEKILDYFKKRAGVDFTLPKAPAIAVVPKFNRRLPDVPESWLDDENSNDFGL